jgi:hypothetical protein
MTRACSSYMVDLSIRHHLVRRQWHSMICRLFFLFLLLLREIVEDCLFCCKRSSNVTNEQPLYLFRRNLCLLQAHPSFFQYLFLSKALCLLLIIVCKICRYLCAVSYTALRKGLQLSVLFFSLSEHCHLIASSFLLHKRSSKLLYSLYCLAN